MTQIDGSRMYKYTAAVVDATGDERIYKRFWCISSDGASNYSQLSKMTETVPWSLFVSGEL